MVIRAGEMPPAAVPAAQGAEQQHPAPRASRPAETQQRPVEETQLNFMTPDQVLLGDSSSSQRSLRKEEELKLSVHMKSFKNHK
ncbi:unnamed protein product [Coccothraustes coccothraustes]